MIIKDILNRTNDPQPYDKGTAVMWTDAHISKQLLALHIDPDNDIASRNTKSIDTITQWILSKIGANSKVLDLGCGPGLYTQRLAKAGHRVKGIDFSQNAIAYAKETAVREGGNIAFVCGDYLEADLGSGYDLVMMIYCDFGVLSIEDRQTLMRKVSGALKPGGIFVFDALNEKTIAQFAFTKSWEMAETGFWKDAPYLCLSELFHYPAHKAILDQHIVIGDKRESDVYRFWNHYFDTDDIKRIAVPFGFSDINSEQILSGGGAYNDDGVTFYTLTKAGENNE